MLRLPASRTQPKRDLLDGLMVRFSPESGERAGYDGAERRMGSKLHMAVDMLGHLLAPHIIPPMPRTARRSASRAKPCT